MAIPYTGVFPQHRLSPSGPRLPGSPGSIIQLGYDQAEKTQEVVPSTGDLFLPRDVPLNPLQVVLPGVVAGNFLEIVWNVGIENANPGIAGLAVVSVVTFIDPPPPFPGPGWFGILNGSDASFGGNDPTLLQSFHLGAMVMVPVPADADFATVRLPYFTETDPTDIVIFGTDIIFPSPAASTLKVTEISGSIVAQPGPSFLVPL